MPNVVSDFELQETLVSTAARWVADGAKLALVKSNWTPAHGDTPASFTEANFSGYARQTVGAWDAPTILAGVASMLATGNPFTFTNTTGVVGNDIYAFAVLNNAGTQILFSGRAAATPIDMNAAGRAVVVVLQYDTANCIPPE